MTPAAPHPSLLVSLGVAALVVWRLYSRVRRMVGRQTLSRRRPWFTVVLFPVLLALLLLGSIAHPINASSLIGGVVLGVALGVYGLRLTKFEATPQGLFYTPSAHLGIALSLLFIARIVFRVAQFYFAEGSAPASPHDLVHSPLTLAIFGTLAGYYVTYAIGLLRWARRAQQPTDL
ncbi:MAG TPA: hypothetical protein VGM74_19910 [Burkholderiaceae bacterium]|jgi:hypothetical protein